MKILFTGGGGLLGKYFLKTQDKKHKLFLTYNKNSPNQISNSNWIKLNVINFNECNKVLFQLKPDLVVHSASLGDVEFCENHKRLAYNTNFVGTQNIIKGTLKISTKLIYISTSYVYDGKKNLYSEKDITNPVNYYGFTKKLSEDEIISKNKNALILRPTTMYGWNNPHQRKNLVSKILSNNKDSVAAVSDRYTNFLYAKDASLYLKMPKYVYKEASLLDKLFKRKRIELFAGFEDVAKAIQKTLEIDKRFKHLFACGHDRVWQRVK